MITWFLFDLGNTLIKLAYERVLENVCRSGSLKRDDLVELLEEPGGYRDMERGAVTFREFYELLADKAGYRGSLHDFREIWSDFFDGPIAGSEELLERIRGKYRVAFLSNSNEVHAELIPRRFSTLFRKDDRFVFSHRFRVAKPDPEMFRRALEVIGALPQKRRLHRRFDRERAGRAGGRDPVVPVHRCATVAAGAFGRGVVVRDSVRRECCGARL